MERVLPWLAVVLAAAMAIVAIYELDQRADEMDEALGPSPPAETAPTTEQPEPAETAGVATTPPTTPEQTATPEPATPEPTVAATPGPATPSPPAVPVDADATPHTGGGAVGGGLAVIALALTLGVIVRRAY